MASRQAKVENGRNNEVIELYCGIGRRNARNDCANRAGNMHSCISVTNEVKLTIVQEHACAPTGSHLCTRLHCCTRGPVHGLSHRIGPSVQA